ncbi:hypothetical protein RHGRI_009358 [Rhododendron griersonianum]|uniref:Uncharacterized protein n=1 Tax=Rhododendron griersonianum TaxID=479676 RepID=A0AAV6KED6_9ERIC|nr:hypothetical protein RHGRI_009358 [Rhododendron griersonianum]
MISQILSSIQPTEQNRKRVTVALPRSILKSAEQLGHHGFTRVYSLFHSVTGSPRHYPGLFLHSQGTWVTTALSGSIPLFSIYS